jgi:hypothetical protein
MPMTARRSSRISNIVTQRPNTLKGSIMVDVFAGIDRSTARHRLAGGGSLLYEARNVFPYIQGRLMRRKDYVGTNSRAASAAFPSFPAQAVVGNAVVKNIVEYRDLICIFYEDSGDTGKLMMDSFDPAANTMTGRLTKAMAFTFDAGGDVHAVVFTNIGAANRDYIMISAKGIRTRYIDKNWVLDVLGSSTFPVSNGMNEVFLQSYFQIHDTAEYQARITRGGVGIFTGQVSYNLVEDVGSITKLISFGYQTSAEGAYTNLIIFKPTSTWLLTDLTSDASLQQISGNIGLAGRKAVVRTPMGVVFIGRDKRGFLNIYLLDRVSLTLHTIGHPLYETLQKIPKANYDDIVVSYDRNRLVRFAFTLTGDANINMQEYWIDFYNGIKSRTFWGPFPLGVQSMSNVIEFSGGNTPANAGFFFLEKSGNTYLIREETELDTWQTSFSATESMVYRTQLFDFGSVYGLVQTIHLVALANGAKYKVSYEEPKAGGTDNDTTITAVGGTRTLGAGGGYQYVPIRITPKIRKRIVGFKIESVSDATYDDPLEASQLGFDYVLTQRGVIE